MDCSICCEPFNKTLRLKVDCLKCQFAACKTCVRQFLKTSSAMPRCMNCGEMFLLKYLVEKLNRSWVYDDFKPYMQNTLLALELGKMPETAAAAEAEKERRHLVVVNSNLDRKARALAVEIRKLKNAQRANTYKMRGLQVPRELMNEHVEGGDPVLLDAKKKFIMACPSACKGFLSTAYKCSLCDKFTCPQCFVVMADKAAHACNDDDVKTAAVIKSETRPCPTCGERIMKNGGCDQMFCTAAGCGTAFSWKTGAIERGAIHNPHFFELQRLGGAVMRNIGDVRCGGMPNVTAVTHVLVRMPELHQKHLAQRFSNTYRALCEITQYAVNDLRTTLDQLQNTRGIRINYLLNDCTKEQLADQLYRRDKERQKTYDMYHLFEILSIQGIETFLAIVQSMPSTATIAQLQVVNPQIMHDIHDSVHAKLQELGAVREYVNKQLSHVSVVYNCSIPEYDEDFQKTMRKYNIHDVQF